MLYVSVFLQKYFIKNQEVWIVFLYLSHIMRNERVQIQASCLQCLSYFSHIDLPVGGEQAWDQYKA